MPPPGCDQGGKHASFIKNNETLSHLEMLIGTLFIEAMFIKTIFTEVAFHSELRE